MPRNQLVRATLDGNGNVYHLLPGGRKRLVKPRVDWAKVDATTEADIARHIKEDEAEADAEAVKRIKAIRKSTGLTKSAFADRIGVSVETVQSWESAKSWPEGPARKLLRALERAPKTVMKALAD